MKHHPTIHSAGRHGSWVEDLAKGYHRCGRTVHVVLSRG